jgi:hypothetical protein
MSLGALMLGGKLGLELFEQLAKAGERRVAPILGAPHGHGDEWRARQLGGATGSDLGDLWRQEVGGRVLRR